MFRRECESIRPLISAFFDGDLTPSESTILHKHLADCTECRAIVDEYQRIRSDIRELPQNTPPDNLANTVWSETVKRPRPTGIRRFFGATTAKVGLSTVAALAILAVISAFLVVRGYNQGITPSIASSEPTTSQNWPVYQPVKIVFNKPMNHQSVEDNLQIWPPGERDRIPMSWQGNTLVLGSSSSQSTLFLPDTAYQVVVLGTAQDAYGHALGQTWSISFTTSTVAQSQTPTPTATSTENPTTQPTHEPAIAAVSPTPTKTSNDGAQSTATSGGTGSDQGSTGQATPTAPASTPTATQSTAPTPTATPTKTATATSTATTQPTPTVTPPPATPTVASTPTETPATPVATPAATPTETQVADASPTADVIAVNGAFGSVYWAHQDVQNKLGAPTDVEAAMNASELGFQRGTMYERYDTGEIYVFFSSNQWSPAVDNWTPADGEGGGAGPDAGLWIPKKAFWKVWSSDPNRAATIGYAVDQDAHLMDNGGGSVQPFAHGIMLYSDQGFVYVVYDDGTWALYPDTSGHGDLLTPTPIPDSTGTPATATPTDTPTDTTGASQP